MVVAWLVVTHSAWGHVLGIRLDTGEVLLIGDFVVVVIGGEANV